MEITQYTPKLTDTELLGLAREVVLFGQSDLDGVLDAHELTHEDFLRLLETSPILEGEIRRLNEQVQSDPNGLIRMRAREMVASSLGEAHKLAMNAPDPVVKLRAIEMLAMLADAKPKDKKEQGFSGPVVQINLGPSAPAPVVEVRNG